MAHPKENAMTPSGVTPKKKESPKTLDTIATAKVAKATTIKKSPPQ